MISFLYQGKQNDYHCLVIVASLISEGINYHAKSYKCLKYRPRCTTK